MKPRLHGLVAAAHTPFGPDGSLQLGMVERQAAHLLNQRLAWAFIGGTTGECHSLGLEERRALARRWLEVTRGTALRVVVHVGANCLADARLLAAEAEKWGAAAIAALSPSYFKPPGAEVLVECCADIARAAPGVPFYYYDIPALTGLKVSAPDFLAVGRGRIPNLAGVKFTNPDLLDFQRCLHFEDGAFDIPYGTDEWLLAALALGARGAVGSSYNFAAPVFHRLLAAFETGDLETARREQFRASRLIHLLSRYGYLGASKAVMGMLGMDVGPARLPIPNPSTADLARLRRELEELGFFDWIR